MASLMAAVLLAGPAVAGTRINQTNGDLLIAKNNYYTSNLYKFGRNIVVEGTLEKDLVVVGDQVVVSGSIGGDVIVMANQVRINGPVKGNVRVFADTIQLDSSIGKNVTLFAENIFLLKNTEIGWDAVMAAKKIRAQAEIGGDLLAASKDIMVSGRVGGNFNLYLNKQGQLTLNSGTIIGRDLNYISQNKLAIPEKTVGGLVNYYPGQSSYAGSYLKSFYAIKIIFSLLGLWLVGLILVAVFKKKLVPVTNLMAEKVGASLLAGAIFVILLPVVVMILLATLIGLPLALIIACLGLLLIYIGEFFVGLLIGQYVWSCFDKKKISKAPLMPAMFLGVFLFFVLISIPVIGWLVKFVGMIWGSGALILGFKERHKARGTRQ